VPSTPIRKFEYDPVRRTLSVWLVASGKRHDYADVDAHIYDGFRRAFAKGVYQEAIHDPQVVHGMLEDYRAGISIDHTHDADDRSSGRRVLCPTMVLWSLRIDLEDLYGDVLEVWRPWVSNELTGKGIDSDHHMAESAPEALAAAVLKFVNKNRLGRFVYDSKPANCTH
jgi:hypothetical protein